MGTVMVTGGLGLTGRHITARLMAGGRSVVSYNRDVAPSEDGVATVQGELFDVPGLVRVLQQHGIAEIVHTAAMSHPTLSLEFPIGQVTNSGSETKSEQMAKGKYVISEARRVV